ncbi:MAG: hypothetical protein ABIJ59_16375 [Pseudomonadota bacterium]
MNDTKKNNIDTIHYILTFFSFVLMVASFATHLFTGKPALLRFDSLAGSLLIGIIFLLYAVWFIYEDIVTNATPVSLTIKTNIKKNPTIICIYFYWIILIIIPFLFNIL